MSVFQRLFPKNQKINQKSNPCHFKNKIDLKPNNI